MKPQNIAILGAGAAGYGTYMAIKELDGVNCSIYNFPEDKVSSSLNTSDLSKRYKRLKKMYGVQLFSTKTNKDLKTPKKINNHFGDAIWDSNISFGLLSSSGVSKN